MTMKKLDKILEELSNDRLATLHNRHLNAFESFQIPDRPTDFWETVKSYLDHHVRSCGMYPKPMSAVDSVANAYREKDSLSAFSENSDLYIYAAAHDAATGNMKKVIKGISELIEKESTSEYIQSVLSSNVRGWDDKVEVVTDLFKRYEFPPFVDTKNPMQYAREYKWLVMYAIQSKKEDQNHERFNQ